MEAASLELRYIFEKDVLHRVPLFQRPYVWNEEDQWRPLWNDIRQLVSKLSNNQAPRAHFVGACVHSKPSVGPYQIETRDLIDGQQRFTTLQLLLKAFQDIVKSVGVSDYADAIEKMTRNNHPLSQSVEEGFKVWPTNADRNDFRRTMEAGSPDAVSAQHGHSGRVDKVNRPIPDAYLYFYNVIENWIAPDGEGVEDRIAILYKTVRENIRMVIIDLDEKDDAQLIFETLNARGTPLLAADLVKNALLQAAEEAQQNVEQLYNDYWHPFDEDTYYWRAEVGPGHARRHRIELYLQHFLTLSTRSEVRADRLYLRFREHSEGGKRTVEQQFSDLAHYGKIFRRLDEREVGSDRIKLALERLDVLDVGTAYPFLLELFSRLEGQTDLLLACLLDIESFLIRRMVCGLSTRGYNTLFIDLLSRIDGTDSGIPKRVRRTLSRWRAETNRWPDDTEFRTAMLDLPIYKTIRRNRLRMVLEALERASRGKKSETDYVPLSLPIEHLMPVAWREHWPLPESRDNLPGEIERDRIVHTIGNLTLLTKALNSSVSNTAWTTRRGGGKRAAIAEHSVLRMNKEIVKYTRWTDPSIRSRSEKLYRRTCKIWPYPATS